MTELSKIEIPVQEPPRSAGWLIGWFGPELMIH